MSTDADDPRAHQLVVLHDLVQSEGWALLVAHLKQEWGPDGYGRKMQTALAGIPAGPDRAYAIERVAEQIDATARAVNEIVEWPAIQMRALTPSASSRRPFASLRRA